jgi:serine/threonine-protein kinase
MGSPFKKLTEQDMAEIEIAGKIGTAKWHIKGASSAGVIHAGIMTIGALLTAFAEDSPAWVGGIVEAGIILLLTFGIYRKSRVAALLLLLFVIASGAATLLLAPRLGPLALAVVFGYFYAQGVRGTFAYHRLVSRHGAVAEAAG